MLAREHAPLTDLLIVADDFALPFGKLRFREAGSHGGHNGLRSIIDELGTEKFSRLRVGIGDPVRQGADHVLSTFAPDERQRLDELARCGGRRRRGVGPRRHEQGRKPIQQLRAPSGRHGSAGRRQARSTGRPARMASGARRTGWRRIRPATPGECTGVSGPPMRGRAARERRLAERVATEFAERHATRSAAEEIDFDVAAVDAEVEDSRTRRDARAIARTHLEQGRRRCARPGAPAGRLPDLSALPPLLAATGAFAGAAGAAWRPADAVPPRRPARRARSASRTEPSRILAAALALGETGERLVWIARDAEIGDRVAEELGAWLGDVGAVAVLEPRTALAYERSELVADETAARVAALAAWRSGRARILVASVQALLQHTIAPDDLPATPACSCARCARATRTPCCATCSTSATCPVLEVAGRGEFARRGGIVDVFPPSLPLPIRIEFFGDEIDSLRAFDPTDQRTVRPVEEAVVLPASEFLLPDRRRGRDPRRALARWPRQLPERLAGDLARFEGDADDPLRPRAPTAPRRSDAGTGRRRRRRGLGALPRTGHGPRSRRARDPARHRRARRSRRGRAVPVAPGRRATRGAHRGGRAPQGLARRPTWPPRDWKGRLVASRTLELTWESEPPAARPWRRPLDARAIVFGWREPSLPLGRAARLADAVEGWQADGARIVLASDQATRLAEILAEAGHPRRRSSIASPRRHRPVPSRSSSGA